MKKIISIIIALVSILVVACHDDPVTPTPAPALRNVGYIACGTPQQAAVDGDGWHALLDSLLTAAEGGCRVTFWNPDAVSSKAADTVTINTADRQQAYRWGEEMYDQGYVVSIIYDESTGTYHGTAVKSTPHPSDYTPIPLADYLPGTWEIDSTGIWYYYHNGLIYFDTIDDTPEHNLAPGYHWPDMFLFASNTLTTAYPNYCGLPISEYLSHGYYDSTLVYTYNIVDDTTISISMLSPINIYCRDSSIFVNGLNMQIFQISQNYFIITPYFPIFYTTPSGLINYECFGFRRIANKK